MRSGINGILSKSFIPISAGVFVGNPNKKDREKIFSKLSKIINAEEFVTMAYSDNNIQGFSINSIGKTSYEVSCVEGIWISKYKSFT